VLKNNSSSDLTIEDASLEWVAHSRLVNIFQMLVPPVSEAGFVMDVQLAGIQ
jgi:hypothetical protein